MQVLIAAPLSNSSGNAALSSEGFKFNILPLLHHVESSTHPILKALFGGGNDVTRSAEQNTGRHRISLTSSVPAVRYEHSR